MSNCFFTIYSNSVFQLSNRFLQWFIRYFGIGLERVIRETTVAVKEIDLFFQIFQFLICQGEIFLFPGIYKVIYLE